MILCIIEDYDVVDKILVGIADEDEYDKAIEIAEDAGTIHDCKMSDPYVSQTVDIPDNSLDFYRPFVG